MEITRAFISISCATLLIFCQASASDEIVKFKNGSSLEFSSPARKNPRTNDFESGWATATFSMSSGNKIVLFEKESLSPVGGVVYQNVHNMRISPSGNYAVLDVLRVGRLQVASDQESTIDSRQYCPALETNTGCIVSMNTGGLCGGAWNASKDVWSSGADSDENDNEIMLRNKDFPVSANQMWSDFNKVRALKLTLKEAVFANLGAVNTLACDPPSKNNQSAYQAIAKQLRVEGDIGSAKSIEDALKRR
ncbi:hypothetical protein [Ralstonia sp. ASV6]|uniref:hypothetical protein n=1 Tax=Ralstonia sp. ASV6 TaxID=2795124 RepID=UPI0018EA6E50|nr:hypothetical protein [Ralstonia sp. ASV6]